MSLVVTGPGLKTPDGTSAMVVSSIDVYPTPMSESYCQAVCLPLGKQHPQLLECRRGSGDNRVLINAHLSRDRFSVQTHEPKLDEPVRLRIEPEDGICKAARALNLRSVVVHAVSPP